MRRSIEFPFVLLCAVATCMAGLASTARADTAFTYQGSLTVAGAPANGAHDFEFGLWDAPTSGTRIGTAIFSDDLAVAQGVFSVILDFGAGSFPGAGRWLEIGVRPGASSDAYTTLSPRRPITASPYAITADTALFAESAGDSDKLDGLDSSFYLVGARGENGSSGILDTTPYTLATLTMNAPTGGFVIVLASIGEIDVTTSGPVFALISVQVADSPPTTVGFFVTSEDKTFVMPMRTLNAVAPAGEFTIKLIGEMSNTSGIAIADYPSLFAIWVPTGPGQIGIP